MTNLFSILLTTITLITGILWFLDKFVFNKYRKCQIIVDSSLDLDKNTFKKNILKPNWLEMSASVFPVLFIVLIVRSFIYEPFQIPSGSMMPTLLIGDLILVEKFSYGIKDPIFQKTLFNTWHPKRGDVVVFKYPNNPRLDYIKRVVGLPGDKVDYDLVEKQITIQSNCKSSTRCESTLPITYSNIEPSDFVQSFSYHNIDNTHIDFLEFSKYKAIPKNSLRLTERKEILGDRSHHILMIPNIQDQLWMYYHQSGQEQSTWIVPPGRYFMMGDNRDNSADSRYWGFVPEENLIGKATIIWMSLKKKENKWPTGIRFTHIGRIH